MPSNSGDNSRELPSDSNSDEDYGIYKLTNTTKLESYSGNVYNAPIEVIEKYNAIHINISNPGDVDFGCKLWW